jgi:hypothetical protein
VLRTYRPQKRRARDIPPAEDGHHPPARHAIHQAVEQGGNAHGGAALYHQMVLV